MAAADRRLLDFVIGQPAGARRQIAHVAVEHGDAGRGVFDEQAELPLALAQAFKRDLFFRDVAQRPDDAHRALVFKRDAPFGADPAFGAVVRPADAKGEFVYARAGGMSSPPPRRRGIAARRRDGAC